MANEARNGKAKWVSIGLPIAIAAISVIGFIYAVGQRTSAIREVVDWKKDAAKQIERMDSQGTLSFSLFHTQYEKEQGKQYERLQKLEDKIGRIDVLAAEQRRLTNDVEDLKDGRKPRDDR